jgi:hypothetical protein
MGAMRIFIAAVLAAIVCFFWGYVSWMLLGWHENGIHGFHEEETMSEMFSKNAQAGHAAYILPFREHTSKLATAEETQAAQDKYQKAMEDGPYVYAVVRPGKSHYSMGNNMIVGLVRSFLAALLLAGFLNITTIPYMARVAICAAAGLFAGLVVDLPMWTWFETPTRDLVVNMVDHIIEWTLGGLVLGALVGKNPTAAHDRSH